MKKRQNKPLKNHSPIKALEFLESMRTLSQDIDQPTVMISIRIPSNILKAIKAKANIENKKYQPMIIEMLRSNLKKT